MVHDVHVTMPENRCLKMFEVVCFARQDERDVVVTRLKSAQRLMDGYSEQRPGCRKVIEPANGTIDNFVCVNTINYFDL